MALFILTQNELGIIEKLLSRSAGVDRKRLVKWGADTNSHDKKRDKDVETTRTSVAIKKDAMKKIRAVLIKKDHRTNLTETQIDFSSSDRMIIVALLKKSIGTSWNSVKLLEYHNHTDQNDYSKCMTGIRTKRIILAKLDE